MKKEGSFRIMENYSRKKLPVQGGRYQVINRVELVICQTYQSPSKSGILISIMDHLWR